MAARDHGVLGPARLLGALALVTCGAVGCQGAGASAPADGGMSVTDDPAPVFTAETRAALAALHYDDGPPPADPSNRVADDAAARAFGQRLFFEKALSGRLLEGDNDGSSATLGQQGQPGKISCAGCHLPDSGFVDTRSPHRQVSLAAQWTFRRTPTLLEVAFAPLYNWDGRRDAIWNQALGVMESNREFNSGRLFVAQQIYRLHRAQYQAIFGALPSLDDGVRFPSLSPETAGCVEIVTAQGSRFACHGVPGDGAEYDAMKPEDQAAVTTVAVNATKALAAYVRRLRCGPGRFDRWLDGEATARLTDGAFHNVGLSPAMVAVAIVDADDHGAAAGIAAARIDPMSTAGAFSDGDRRALPAAPGPALEGAFRTPTLRCVSSRPSFMHTGQLGSLDQVLSFFDRGGDPAGGYLGQNELAPLHLTDRQRADIAAFLDSLTGPGPDASLLVSP